MGDQVRPGNSMYTPNLLVQLDQQAEAMTKQALLTLHAQDAFHGQGTKADTGKLPLDLVDTTFEEAIAQVLAFGAKKYAPNNWRKGLAQTRVYAAIKRHLNAWHRGEDLDQESGLPHLAHAACELMFLYVFSQTRPDLDDRIKGDSVVKD